MSREQVIAHLSQDFGDNLRLAAVFYSRYCAEGRKEEARAFCIHRCGEARTKEIIEYAKQHHQAL